MGLHAEELREQKKYNFETLTPDKVEMGDLLVGYTSMGNASELLQVFSKDKECISGQSKYGMIRFNYDDAVVLKPDGRHLVGRRVQERFEEFLREGR